MKEENPWEKIGYDAWYRRLSVLNGNTNMGKPNEMTTITHMAETNAYLTKRINAPESKIEQDTQATNQDPTTCTIPMNETNKTWVTVAAKLAHLKQPTPLKPRPTQTSTN